MGELATTNQKFEIQEFGSDRQIVATMDDVRRLIAEPTKSGKQATDREIELFLTLCKSRRLDPFSKDAFLVGYDGKDGPKFETFVSYQALLKRAEAHPEYAGKKGGVSTLDGA